MTEPPEPPPSPATGGPIPWHRPPEERAALGRAARRRTPRSAHADYEPGPTRPDPVTLLEDQARSRVPELVPIRYGRMLASPFAFFRGAALIMASDLAGTPRTGFSVQACGDAHLSNFGVFASPERSLVFDLNDFDETLPAPWEWDVKRLAASLAVAGRDRGFSARERQGAIVSCVGTYRAAMAQWAASRHLDLWYARVDVDRLMAEFGPMLRAGVRRRTAANLAKARTRDSLQALSKLTRVVDGQRRIVADPPLVVPIEDLVPGVEAEQISSRLNELLERYRMTLQSDRRHLLERYRLVQMARKVVGVGSVGTRAWILLLVGRDDGDPLFLQAKEAQPSVLERFTAECQYPNQGERVVAGQHLMQASSDIFLGWERIEGIDGQPRDFYLRQLRDWKGGVDVETMVPDGLSAYGRLCGWTLARAHARSGDPIAIAAYLGRGTVFDEAIAAFAERYADQNEADHAALRTAVDTGRVRADTGL